ncbi:MAG: 3-deoxy-manno-octulosonate cytidylyltransferase, partial [Oscillospiraceae bacterium]
RSSLEYYKNTPRGVIERIEDIEMLRMIENHKMVKVVKVENESLAVDTQKDLERIRKIISERNNDN